MLKPIRLQPKFSIISTIQTRLYCIGTEITPVKQGEQGPPKDDDDSWKTKANPAIVCVKREPFTVRPELITFDAMNTLIEPSQSIGRWYREALNIACDMQIRLPRPALFSAAFKKVYNDMNNLYPCFGALAGMTAEKWWYEMLYHDVFSTKAGWIIKEDVEYTLNKLVEWRDQGSGPKLGIISNTDDRLSAVLSDLGLSKYFDFILTSYEVKSSKPDKKIFDQALKRIGLKNPSACYHVGDSITSDVNGAVKAGWTAIRINENFDEDFPDWFDIDTAETVEAGIDKRMALMNWGRKDITTSYEWVEIWGLDDILQLFGFPEDLEKPIATTVLRGYTDD